MQSEKQTSSSTVPPPSAFVWTRITLILYGVSALIALFPGWIGWWIGLWVGLSRPPLVPQGDMSGFEVFAYASRGGLVGWLIGLGLITTMAEHGFLSQWLGQIRVWVLANLLAWSGFVLLLGDRLRDDRWPNIIAHFFIFAICLWLIRSIALRNATPTPLRWSTGSLLAMELGTGLLWYSGYFR